MRPILLPAILVALAASSPTQAGESYDNCAGFIDSVPATITTQGVWCLRADLSTAITSGSAITVDVNNVTIDCNRFKLGGLGAGPASTATGISSNRLNTSVMNCNVRGFSTGIRMESGAGHLIESNRLDGNLQTGLYVWGEGSMVRNNQVFDTGGSTSLVGYAFGMYVRQGVDVIGNTVVGVSPEGGTPGAHGIRAFDNSSGSIRDNRIRAVVANANVIGISASITDRLIIRDNDIQGTGIPGSIGISCDTALVSTGGNFIAGFGTAVEDCASSNNTVTL